MTVLSKARLFLLVADEEEEEGGASEVDGEGADDDAVIDGAGMEEKGEDDEGMEEMEGGEITGDKEDELTDLSLAKACKIVLSASAILTSAFATIVLLSSTN